jgi:hypothetical protein
VAIAHIVVLSAALLTLLVLPCVVTTALRGARERSRDDVLRAAWRYYESDYGRDETVDLHRLDQAMVGDRPVLVPVPAGGASIEQIACDLRRLGQQRHAGLNLASVEWQAAVLRAYDQRLTLACRCLEITEHLEPLDGMDRDLERLRVECELQAAGFAL